MKADSNAHSNRCDHEVVAGGMEQAREVGLYDGPRQASQRPGRWHRARARIKRCWVTDRHGRLPALLHEWRRTAAGFQGRVIHPVVEPDGGWVVVEEWLPAPVLDPA